MKKSQIIALCILIFYLSCSHISFASDLNKNDNIVISPIEALKISDKNEKNTVKFNKASKDPKVQPGKKRKKKKKFNRFHKNKVYANKLSNESIENMGSSVNIINRNIINILNPSNILYNPPMPKST